MSEITIKETKEQMVRVLNEYVKCGVIGIACDLAGVSRNHHTKWLEQYPAYKEMFETMRERFTDGLEVVAIQRAKEKSDSLMQMMLKAHRPEVYGDKGRLELNKDESGKITLLFAEGMLSPREKALLDGGVTTEGGLNEEM